MALSTKPFGRSKLLEIPIILHLTDTEHALDRAPPKSTLIARSFSSLFARRHSGANLLQRILPKEHESKG